MSTHELTHILAVQIDRYVRGRRYTGEHAVTHELYRGSADDCDAVALQHDVTSLTTDLPTNADYAIPYHDRVYTRWNEDGSVTEVWCRAESVETSPLAHQIEDLPPAPDRKPEVDEFQWPEIDLVRQITLFEEDAPRRE